MPLWVVTLTVYAAVFKLIPQLVARTCAVSCGPEDAERTVEMFARIVSHSLHRRARWISAAVTTEVHQN
jgi:hypothetical protein